MDAMKAPRVVWGALILIGLASVGVSLKTSHDTGETNDRLCTFIKENARVAQIRSAATLKRDAATDAFLGGAAELGAKGGKPSPFTELSRVYLKASAEVSAERARNPLPSPPADC